MSETEIFPWFPKKDEEDKEEENDKEDKEEKEEGEEEDEEEEGDKEEEEDEEDEEDDDEQDEEELRGRTGRGEEKEEDVEEVDKEAKKEEAKSRAKNTKNNNDVKKKNKEKNSSGNHCLSRTNLLPSWGETCFELRQGCLGRKYVSRSYCFWDLIFWCFVLFQLLNLPQESPTRVVLGRWAWGCSLEISRMSWGGHVFDTASIPSNCSYRSVASYLMTWENPPWLPLL